LGPQGEVAAGLRHFRSAPENGHSIARRANYPVLGGGMTHWTASVVAILLASFPGVANTRTDREAIPRGPERTSP
jgi:hypothetical protein